MGKENLSRSNGKSKGRERRQRVGLRQLKQRLMEGWLEDNQQEVWRPKEGAKVYVDWESFPESATTTWKSWTVQEWAVEGFYRQKIYQLDWAFSRLWFHVEVNTTRPYSKTSYKYFSPIPLQVVVERRSQPAAAENL